MVKKIETELNTHNGYTYANQQHVKASKSVLQQFLPELENLKTKMMAKN